MRHAFFSLALAAACLCTFFCRVVSSQTAASVVAPQQALHSSYYVRNGDALQAVEGDPVRSGYTEWQVWLYPQSVRAPQSGLGLAYTRWGVIDGPSARAVMEQLASYRQFERAYTGFFAADTWGRYTFAYPLGPIAVAEQGQRDFPNDLLSKMDVLNQRLESVVSELRPSLENGEPGDAPAPVQQYFEQVRSSMQDVARFYDKLSRLPAERNYLGQILARLMPGVNQAESVVPKVTAILPSVKLPVSKDWMTRTENMGREGKVSLTVTEVGSSAWVQQSWTEGDGSMTGTKIITIVPYQAIGRLHIWASHTGDGPRWTLRVQPANPRGFPQRVTSPVRTTATRTYPAVDLKTSEESIFLDFSDPSEAQDAYAFFLYHKQRGI